MYNTTGNAAQQAQNKMNAAGQAMGNSAKQATAFTGSIAKLTQSMVLFSVLLPVVRLPQTAIRSFQDMVEVGTEWEHQIRSINSLLGLQGDQFNQLNNQMKSLANTYGLTTDEVGNAGKQIASTLGVVKRNQDGMTAAAKATDDYNTSMQLMNDIAKLSVASFEDMNTVTESAFTVLATGNFTVDQANKAFDELFKTVQVGRTTFSQFNQDAGKFIPLAENWIQATDDADQQLQRLVGTMDVFSAASQKLGSARAATGVGRVFQAMAGTSQQQQALITQTETFRRRRGLGEEYNITPQALMSISDPVEQFQRLTNVLGPNSPLVDQYINQLRNRGRLTDEGASRAAAADQLQKRYFEQVQAVRAFQAATPASIAQASRDRAASGGEQAAYDEAMKDPKKAADRLSSAMVTLKATVFESLQSDFLQANNGFATLFANINKNITDNKITGFFNTMGSIFKQIGDAFNTWYSTGGKADIARWGYTMGSDLSKALDAFLKGDEAANAFIDAGKTFAEKFIEGVKDQLPQLMLDAVQSSLVRAIATFILLKKLPGVGVGTAAAGGVASTAFPTSGVAGTAANLGVLGLLGLVGGKALLSRGQAAGTAVQGSAVMGQLGGIFPGPAPVTATAPGNLANLVGSPQALASRMGVSVATVNRWIAGTQKPSAANQALLNTIIPGVAAPTRTQTALSSTFGKGNLALQGGLAALQVAQAVSGPEQGRGSAIGSALGSLGGGLLGAFGGSLIAPGPGTFLGGAAGSMAGGLLGGMAGDWIQQNLFGGNQQAALAGGGTGMGPGTEAADDLTSIFILGLNNSSVAKDLEQMNRKMDIQGKGGIVSAAAKPGATQAGTTGAGPGLTNSFVNQITDAGTLTSSQAKAACGPAAVDFFVKAYGRNPTLAEAYTMVQSFQTDTPIEQRGSNINAMGQAITKLGGPAADVYNGPNIDWGRLANNAQAGIPGIVNIGPSGNFPGHFFQIGGWDPSTNKFNVGASGTVLAGGKAQMTPQEMMALGPAMGAIYGTTAPAAGPSGKGGVDPDILAAIGGTETGSIGKSKGEMTLGITTAAASGKGSSGMQWGTDTAGAVAAGQPGAFWAYKNQSEAADAFKSYIHANMPDLEPYLGDSQAFFQHMIDTQSNYYVPMAGGKSKTAYYTDWKNTALKKTGYYPGTGKGPGVGGLVGASVPWGNMGTGMGAAGGGGGVVVNGPLIGSVNLSGSATQDDADNLAAMIADALENLVNTGGGGTVGQNKIFKS